MAAAGEQRLREHNWRRVEERARILVTYTAAGTTMRAARRYRHAVCLAAQGQAADRAPSQRDVSAMTVMTALQESWRCAALDREELAAAAVDEWQAKEVMRGTELPQLARRVLSAPQPLATSPAATTPPMSQSPPASPTSPVVRTPAFGDAARADTSMAALMHCLRLGATSMLRRRGVIPLPHHASACVSAAERAAESLQPLPPQPQELPILEPPVAVPATKPMAAPLAGEPVLSSQVLSSQVVPASAVEPMPELMPALLQAHGSSDCIPMAAASHAQLAPPPPSPSPPSMQLLPLPPPPPPLPVPLPLVPLLQPPTLPAEQLSAPAEQPQPELADTSARDNPAFQPYVRMLKMGVPLPAVQQKMVKDGLAADARATFAAAFGAAASDEQPLAARPPPLLPAVRPLLASVRGQAPPSSVGSQVGKAAAPPLVGALPPPSFTVLAFHETLLADDGSRSEGERGGAAAAAAPAVGDTTPAKQAATATAAAALVAAASGDAAASPLAPAGSTSVRAHAASVRLRRA